MAGVTVALLLRHNTPAALLDLDQTPTLADVLAQTLLVLALVTVVAVTLTVLGRRRSAWSAIAPLACVVLLISMGIPAGVRLTTTRLEATPTSAVFEAPTIGRGGIEAARWLRDHTDTDDAWLRTRTAASRTPPAVTTGRPGSPVSPNARCSWRAGRTPRETFQRGRQAGPPGALHELLAS